MKISIVKDTPTRLCYLIIFYTLFIGFFTLNFGVPVSVYYLGDALNILLLVMISPRLVKSIKRAEIKTPALLLMLLVIIGTFAAIIHGLSIVRWIWALRNWGRFFAFFLACICVLDKKNIDRILDFFVVFFHLNFVVILIQYIAFGIMGDSANGLIGRETSSVNLLFILIITVIAISKYQTKKIFLPYFIFLLIEISVVNFIAELKGNYVFLLILLVAIYLFNSKARGKDILKFTAITILGCIVVYMGFTLIIKHYPIFGEILTVEGFMRQMNSEYGYGNVGIYDRLNAITVTNNHFFKLDILLKCFGYGIGNTEYSVIDALKSSFYNQYGRTYSYLNFSLPIVYLETGMCGLILFFATHISLLRKTVIEARRNNRIDKYYCNVGMGMLIVAIIFIIYNNLHRTDASFLMAFMCSIPFALLYRFKGKCHEKN